MTTSYAARRASPTARSSAARDPSESSNPTTMVSAMSVLLDPSGHFGASAATSGGRGGPPSGGGRSSIGSGFTRKNAPSFVPHQYMSGIPASSVPSPSHSTGLTPSQLIGGSSYAGSVMSLIDHRKMTLNDRPPMSGSSPTKKKFLTLVKM